MNNRNVDLLKKYIEHVSTVGKIATSTLEIYKKEIEDYFEYLNETKAESVNEEKALGYVEYLKNKFSSHSIKRKLVSVNALYKYLLMESIVNFNPFQDVKVHGESTKINTEISYGEINRVLDFVKDDLKGKRDKLIIYLLHTSPFKINDILNIYTHGVINSKEINLIIKSSVEKINLDKQGSKLLEEYLDLLKSSGVSSEKLFPELTRQAFRARFIKYCEEAGIKKINPIDLTQVERVKINNKDNKNLNGEEIRNEYFRIRIGDEG